MSNPRAFSINSQTLNKRNYTPIFSMKAAPQYAMGGGETQHFERSITTEFLYKDLKFPNFPMSNPRAFSINSQTLNKRNYTPIFSMKAAPQYAMGGGETQHFERSITTEFLYKDLRSFQAQNPNFQIP